MKTTSKSIEVKCGRGALMAEELEAIKKGGEGVEEGGQGEGEEVEGGMKGNTF